MKKELFIFDIVLLIFIASLNQIAISFHLYWLVWWFDILMHFLGGLWVGLSALWFVYFSDFLKFFEYNKRNIFLISLITTIVVGLGWEVFEFIIEVDFSNGYWKDTIQDLIMDTIGAITASIILINFYKK